MRNTAHVQTLCAIILPTDEILNTWDFNSIYNMRTKGKEKGD
jgi:hypothetical protein